ncbi:MAG: CPBP family intramembrane metalloprotease [Candidatus Lokiarchaeota archaeon]|nr:CPBP family intramembrane metalloprotease [Candidatus Lokiarchaeota archaeon]
MAGPATPPSNATPEGRALARRMLLLSLCITGLYLMVGFKWFFSACFGGMLTPWQFALAWPIYRYCVVACLLWLVPWYISTRKWRLKASDLGWRKGNARLGYILTAIGLAISVPAGIIAAGDPSMVSFYPWERVFVDPAYGELNLGGFVAMEAMYVVLYYVPYEFFFRGVSMLPLVERGSWRGTWIVLYTTAITTVVHWDVPATELVSAFAVGFIFGIAAMKCGSFRYVLIVHAAIGVMTNITCMLALQGFF